MNQRRTKEISSLYQVLNFPRDWTQGCKIGCFEKGWRCIANRKQMIALSDLMTKLSYEVYICRRLLTRDSSTRPNCERKKIILMKINCAEISDDDFECKLIVASSKKAFHLIKGMVQLTISTCRYKFFCIEVVSLRDSVESRSAN